MATYTELYEQHANSALLNRIAFACADQANVIRDEDPGTANHANRAIWAKQAFMNPSAKAQEMLWALLAINKGLTIAQINGATDAGILSAVATAVDIFATGE